MTRVLPWVKWHTQLLQSGRWRTIPMDERGVYAHLILLAGSSSVRGLIKDTDAEIAGLLGCDPALVTRTVERLSREPFDSLKRTKRGLLIIHWDTYQAPANYDPAAEYGRLAVDRKRTESTPKAPTESGPNVEKSRGEKRRTTPRISSISLRALPSDEAWWNALAKQYPLVDLVAELVRAQDWHGADKVKSPKLYFRNWVERAARDQAERPHEAPTPTGSIEAQMRELEERMAVPA